MAFFSWFKSKSGSSAPEAEISPATKPKAESEVSEAALNVPSHEAVPRFRETVPQSARTVLASPGISRSSRTTIDIPLQSLWQSLPEGLAQKSAFLDFRRRIQIPRKEVRINDTDHTGTVSLYVLHAVCPDIFAAPVPAVDNRSVRFSLPAWERVRSAEIIQVATEPESEKSAAGLPVEEKAGQQVEGQTETSTDKGQSETRVHPLIANGEARSLEAENRVTGPNVRVALLPLLRSLPSGLGNPNLYGLAEANHEIELPFDLIQAQLPEGRVSLPMRTFLRALPETVRSTFGDVNPSTQIPIPLKEILRGLPNDALALRSDQEVEELPELIDTPFSVTAREEADRFRLGTRVEPGPIEEPKAEETQLELPSTLIEESKPSSSSPEAVAVPPTKPDFSTLQSVFLTEEELDLPGVAQKIASLPGLQCSLLSTAAGHKLAGELGDSQLEQKAITVFPALFAELKTRLDTPEGSSLETLTLCWRQEQVSVFSDGRFCLTVRHGHRPFKPGVREKLVLIFSRLADALSSSEI
jgi:hypothetical protein